MDIEVAKTFLSILEAGSFNAAAEILHVTQSTVSMRIENLEDYLGRTLFERNRGGIQLTQAGQYFLPHATAMFRAWEQARQEIALPEDVSSILSIGGQMALWDNLLAKWVSTMRKNFPDVALRAEIGLSDTIMRYLITGTIDLAVMYTPQGRPNFTLEELMIEQLVLVSSSQTSSAPRSTDYIYVDWGPEFKISHTNAFPDLDSATLTISHGPMALQYVLENGGSAYFPTRLVDRHIKSKELYLQKKAPVFQRPVFMVYPTSREDEDDFKVALETLRKIAQAAMAGA